MQGIDSAYRNKVLFYRVLFHFSLNAYGGLRQKSWDKALTLISEGGPNFGVRHYPKSLGMSQDSWRRPPYLVSLSADKCLHSPMDVCSSSQR